MNIKLRLTLDVTYDVENEMDRAALTDLLMDLPRRAYAEGLMSGNTAAEVHTWESKVEEV